MIRIYVPRIASKCHYPFAEVEDSLPVHPGDLQARVRKLLATGQPWATQSDIVIAMLGWMASRDEINLPLSIIYINAKGQTRENIMDMKGGLVMPWPEDGFESILDAAFFYRFSD